MAAPAILDLSEPVRTNDHIIRALAAGFAAISVSAVTRSLCWTGVPLGIWLVLAPWILGYDEAAAIGSDSAAGVVLAALAPGGKDLSDRFGGGWSALWSPEQGVETGDEQRGRRGPLPS